MQNKVHKSICTVTGHPVDVASGKVFTTCVDFGSPGPIPLAWERTWYSSSVYEGPVGHGWHHPYDLALLQDGKAVAVRMEDGRPCGFPALDMGGSHYDRGEKLTLFRDLDGYGLRKRDGLVFRFAPAASAKGWQPLERVMDGAGNAIRFSYNPLGRLSTLQDSGGRLFCIAYDSAGRIVQIQGPDPVTWTAASSPWCPMPTIPAASWPRPWTPWGMPRVTSTATASWSRRPTATA